jgi:GLPGLI family protein
MNLKHFMIFVFYFAINQIYSQTNHSIFCEYYFIPNMSSFFDSEKQKDSTSLYAKVDHKSLGSIKYNLIQSKYKSMFFSTSDENIFDDVKFNDDDLFTNIKLSEITSITFKDFKNYSSLQREYIFDKKFIIKDSLLIYNWKMINEERLINGLKCLKATTIDCFNNMITAWYSLDFPISNGPSIYHGLPGLIVEIQSKNFSYHLSKINIIKEINELKFEEKGHVVKQNEFVEIFNRKMKERGFLK